MLRIVLLALIVPAPLLGGIVLDVAIAPPSPTSSIAIVSVSARKQLVTDPDVLLEAANLAIDLGNDGYQIPAGFTLDSVSSTPFSATLNTLTPMSLAAAGQTPNFDAIVNLNTGAVNIDSVTNTPLFELKIAIASGVAPSTKIPLSIVEEPVPGGFFRVDATSELGPRVDVDLSTSPGSVSVVPEVNGFWLLMIAAIGTCSCRRLGDRVVANLSRCRFSG